MTDNRASPAANDSLLICHGVIRSADAAVFTARHAAMPDGPPVCVVDGVLAAVATRLTCSSDLAMIKTQLSTVEGASSLAIRHAGILNTIVERIDVVPFRLGIIHSDENALRAHLRGEEAMLQAALARVAGAIELGVKLYSVTETRPAPRVEGPSGRDYLRARQRAREGRNERRQECEQVIARVDQVMCDIGSQKRSLPVPPQGLAERQCFHGAYLVARHSLGSLDARLADLSALSEAAELRLSVTGPWAPFHFVEPQEAIHG